MRYLIDGYNLAHALGLVHGKRPGGAELVRRSLLVHLREAPGLDPGGTTVVFDAMRAPPGSPSRQDFLGFRVLFAKGEQADDLIEELIHKETSPRQLTVVSDDRRLKEAASRRGCGALGCLDFLEAVLHPLTSLPQPPTGPDEESDKPESLSAEELKEWQRVFGADEGTTGEEW
jgi:predicted RNA-binding protein with PIN domain